MICFACYVVCQLSQPPKLKLFYTDLFRMNSQNMKFKTSKFYISCLIISLTSVPYMMKTQLNQQSKRTLTTAQSASLRTTQILPTAQSNITSSKSKALMFLSTTAPTQLVTKHLLLYIGFSLRLRDTP